MRELVAFHLDYSRAYNSFCFLTKGGGKPPLSRVRALPVLMGPEPVRGTIVSNVKEQVVELVIRSKLL